MDVPSLIDILEAAVPGAEIAALEAVDRPTLLVPRQALLEVMRALRDSSGFDVLTEVTAVDWWPNAPRFEVVYHLLDTRGPAVLRVVVRLEGEDAHLPSVHTLWPSADWLEREVWDLFGIVFDEHGDLRRLLMPEDWEGHPLRKDYPVQITMTPKVYEPLQLTEQEFRANVAADRNARGGGARRQGR